MSVRPKIDEVDVSLLKTLLKDPRTIFTEIAKDCGLSTNAIRMRFKKLKKTGVITGAIMQVNPKSLGFNCIAFLMIQADTNQETSVYDFLEKTPSIIKNFTQIGRYNIISFVALKSVGDLSHTIEHVRSHPYIRNVEHGILIDVTNMDHPESLIIDTFNGLTHTTGQLSKNEDSKTMITSSHVSELAAENHLWASHELDKIDLQIIRVLSENADMSFRKVANQIGISTPNLIGRYKRLRKEVLPY